MDLTHIRSGEAGHRGRRPASAPFLILLAVSLIVGLVAIHALASEGSVDASSPLVVSAEHPGPAGGVDAAACSGVCSEAMMSSSGDLWMAILACGMILLKPIWRRFRSAFPIGMRRRPVNAPERAVWHEPPAARPDLISLGIQRT